MGKSDHKTTAIRVKERLIIECCRNTGNRTSICCARQQLEPFARNWLAHVKVKLPTKDWKYVHSTGDQVWAGYPDQGVLSIHLPTHSPPPPEKKTNEGEDRKLAALQPTYWASHTCECNLQSTDSFPLLLSTIFEMNRWAKKGEWEWRNEKSKGMVKQLRVLNTIYNKLIYDIFQRSVTLAYHLPTASQEIISDCSSMHCFKWNSFHLGICAWFNKL